VISQKGQRDGEDIWSSKDSEGHYVIQEVIGKAVMLKPGEMTTVRYRWQNPGEASTRWKIARLAYYAPWNWVIGTSVHEDELLAYHDLLKEGRLGMTRVMGMAGIIIILIVGIIGIIIAWTITWPVRHMTRVAEKITQGDLNQVVEVDSRDEIGSLARTFNLMTAKLRQSIEELRKSEEKYRGIFENANEGVFQISLKGRILSANPALAHILGYDSAEELISAIAKERQPLYVRVEDRDRLFAFILKNRAASRFEIQLYRKDGEKVWASISARVVNDDDGQPAWIEGFLMDVSARKYAEEALAESGNYLDEIINAVGDPMFVKDRNHRWVLVNNALCGFLEHTREELLGKTDYDFFAKSEADVFWAMDTLVLNSGKENINEETITDAQGTVHTIVTKKTLYTDKKGEPFIVGILRDISDQKMAAEEKARLEARLTQAQKM
jgi:PAS domain S-box-containing protein